MCGGDPVALLALLYMTCHGLSLCRCFTETRNDTEVRGLVPEAGYLWLRKRSWSRAEADIEVFQVTREENDDRTPTGRSGLKCTR